MTRHSRRGSARAGVFLMHHPDNFFMWRVIAPRKLAERLGVARDQADAALFAMLAGAKRAILDG